MTQMPHTDTQPPVVTSPGTMDDIKGLLFDQFPVLADAPQPMPRMRELILQLAVRGKLVPQDPNDESASELLKKIAAEKARLVAEGKIRKQKPLPPINPDDVPYDLPGGWTCERLGNITTKTGSGSTPRGGRNVYAQEGVMFLRSQNVWNHGLEVRDVARIPSKVHSDMEGTHVQSQDLLLNITGASIGRCAVVPNDYPQANVSQHVCIIRLVDPETRNFVHSLLISPDFQQLIMDVQVGMSREGLSKKRLDLFPIPLPPLAEQRRIVAKVDQLMALCDELEARQDQRNQGRIRLNKAALHSLTEAQEPEAFTTHWNRIHSHFDLLYDTPETVPDLRQAILQLAVRGRLVPQDPSDEPASELLKKIAAEKARLVAEGKIRKSKPLPPIDPEEVPYDLPEGWGWARFGDGMVNRDGERIPVSREDRASRQGQYDYYGASGVIDHIDDYLFDKPLLLIGEDGANLINRATPIAFIATGKYWVNNHAHVLDAISWNVLRYMELFINATDLVPYVTGTAQPKMNQQKMNTIPVALPPEFEQQRIVAKVDQLMALCDELETKLGAAQVVQGRLLDAVVDQVVNGG